MDSTDTLLFTFELYNVIDLRVVVPIIGKVEPISLGDNSLQLVALPVGFNATSLDVQEIDNFRRNISLTFTTAHIFFGWWKDRKM